jgi:nascent polypeptide-associated complex subunit alpha
MFPKINPKKMQEMMRQMGISEQEIDASRVTIEKRNGSRIILDNPSVTKVVMQGQDTFQITGDYSEENPEDGINPEDIQTVMEKTGCTEEEAKESLEKNSGNLADAIMELSG